MCFLAPSRLSKLQITTRLRVRTTVFILTERRTDNRRKLFGLKSNWDVYLKMRSRRKTNSFFRKGTDSMIPKVRVHFTPDTVQSSEMRKTKPTSTNWASSTWLVATAGRPFRVRTSPGCLNSRWPKISACVCSLNRSKLQRVIRISLGEPERRSTRAPHPACTTLWVQTPCVCLLPSRISLPRSRLH